MIDPVNCLVPNNLEVPVKLSEDGMLAGLTFVAKDLFDVIGHRTSNGSLDFYRQSLPSKENAAAIDKLLNSGATLLGMSICDEFFYSLTGANEYYGTPVNSLAPERLPGGSSSGSAAAVAAGLVDFSLGSDTGGSVRIPASFCGIWGVRPTLGRVNLVGARPMAPSFDTVGWFSSEGQHLSDVADVLLEGNQDKKKISEIIIAEDVLAQTDKAVAEAFTDWHNQTLANKGKFLTVSPDGLGVWWEVFRIIQAGEVKKTNLPWVRAHNASLGPGIRERFLIAEAITETELEAALEHRKQIVRHLLNLISSGTALIVPTAPCIAPLRDADEAALDKFRSRAMAMTCIAGLAGLPQVSMPALMVDGCPVGVSFIGSPGSDEQLIELALSLS